MYTSSLTMTTPEPCAFIHLGIHSGVPVRTPLVPRTARRRTAATRVIAAAEALEQHIDVVSARVFQAAVLPPLPGLPRHDLAVLIRVENASALDGVRESESYRRLGGTELLAGINAAKFGETEASTNGYFLFNHFTVDGDSDPLEAWLGLTDWYASKIGVDNSTALRRGDGESSRFPFVNYVRLPSSPPTFLANQLLRPSFHRVVRRTLEHNGMRALPGFYRMIR